MDIKAKDTPVESKKSGSKKKFLKKPSGSNKNLLLYGLIALLALAIVSSVVFYNKYQDIKNNPKDAITAKNSQETSEVLTALKKIILIESTDAPTVARVENPDTLKKNNAVFYKNVAKGDYLIIFKDRAIIFRASTNQIINVAPIINTAELEAKKAEQAKQNQTNTTTKKSTTTTR